VDWASDSLSVSLIIALYRNMGTLCSPMCLTKCAVRGSRSSLVSWAVSPRTLLLPLQCGLYVTHLLVPEGGAIEVDTKRLKQLGVKVIVSTLSSPPTQAAAACAM